MKNIKTLVAKWFWTKKLRIHGNVVSVELNSLFNTKHS